MSANGRSYRVHLDGYNFLPYFQGQADEGPRDEMFYFTDDGSVSALRYHDWKLNFTTQRAHGLEVWSEPYVVERVPVLTNLRQDPFERAQHEAIDYNRWFIDHMFVLVPAQAYVGNFLQTFQEFPPRQKPGSFSLDNVLEELQQPQPN
jgi:arylsulfatase